MKKRSQDAHRDENGNFWPVAVPRRELAGRTLTAYHEAGHAVVARALGWGAAADLGPSARDHRERGRTVYYSQEGEPEKPAAEVYADGALRSLAGPIAERLALMGDGGAAASRFRGVSVAPLSVADLRGHVRFLREMDKAGLCDDYRKAAACAGWLNKPASWLVTVARQAQRLLIARWADVEEERRRLMRRSWRTP